MLQTRTAAAYTAHYVTLHGKTSSRYTGWSAQCNWVLRRWNKLQLMKRYCATFQCCGEKWVRIRFFGEQANANPLSSLTRLTDRVDNCLHVLTVDESGSRQHRFQRPAVFLLDQPECIFHGVYESDETFEMWHRDVGTSIAAGASGHRWRRWLWVKNVRHVMVDCFLTRLIMPLTEQIRATDSKAALCTTYNYL